MLRDCQFIALLVDHSSLLSEAGFQGDRHLDFADKLSDQASDAAYWEHSERSFWLQRSCCLGEPAGPVFVIPSPDVSALPPETVVHGLSSQTWAASELASRSLRSSSDDVVALPCLAFPAGRPPALRGPSLPPARKFES